MEGMPTDAYICGPTQYGLILRQWDFTNNGIQWGKCKQWVHFIRFSVSYSGIIARPSLGATMFGVKQCLTVFR